MTACPDREPMLQALLDGELDAANAAATEAHLRGCVGCAAHFQALEALRTRLAEADLSEPAPDHLGTRIEAALAAEDSAAAARANLPARTPWWRNLVAAWSSAGAMTAVAAGLLMVQLTPAPMSLADQLVASHVRSLQANHLIDVATSDRHVVKPWFNGRIDYAPPVPDLATQGFPLAGGRLDYADGHTVAAIVYRRRAHVINLFVMPARGGFALPRPVRPPPGYAVKHWQDGGLDFWAVSDVAPADLQAFHTAFEAASLP